MINKPVTLSRKSIRCQARPEKKACDGIIEGFPYTSLLCLDPYFIAPLGTKQSDFSRFVSWSFS